MARIATTCPPAGGFTLVEMLTSLAVLAVVLSLAVPTLTEFVGRHELKTAHDRLFTQLHLARTLAIGEGRRIVLCPSLDGETCAPDPDWERGLMVFADEDASREREPPEEVIRVTQAIAGDVRVSTSRARRRISYFPSGRSPGSNVTFTVCHRDPDVAPRAIIISNQGRVRSSRTRPGGKPIVCPA